MSDILTISIFSVLPELFSQEGTDDPILYIKLHDKRTDWVAYLAEGGILDDDYQIYGLFTGGRSRTWMQISLSKFLRGLRENGVSAVPDSSFVPSRMSFVVGYLRSQTHRSR